MEDLYRILGVQPDASQEEITKQYQFLVLSYNPDRYPSQEMKEKAAIELRKINDVFLILIDPTQRSRYDQARKSIYSISAQPKFDNQEQSTTEVKNPTESLQGREKVLWLILGLILVGLFIAVIMYSQNQPVETAVILPTSTTVPTHIKPTATVTKIQPTRFPTKIYPTEKILGQGRPENATQAAARNCTNWDQITIDLIDQSKCVKGIVKSTYWGEKETFYITFSDDPKSFRLVRLDGYYYKDIVGKCVGVVGIIKVLDQVPYIEMKETIGIYSDISTCD